MAEKHVVAKPIRPVKEREVSNREIWASVCYYYPQYTLEEASHLRNRDINTLLKVAKRLEAIKFQKLTQIAAAPHTEKGKGVKDLINSFQEIIDS